MSPRRNQPSRGVSRLFSTVPLRTIPRSLEGPNGCPFRARTRLASRTREIARSESQRALQHQDSGEDGLLRQVDEQVAPGGKEEAVGRRIGTPFNGARLVS